MNTKPKVVIAMSGGVDSAVAAALLKEQGYDVTGLTLRLWHHKHQEQSGLGAAQEVADKLRIPLHVLDAREDFRREVVQAFLDYQAQGLTPNPCIFCNRIIKWSKLLRFADEQEAQSVATGHYAQIRHESDGLFQLWRAVDSSKDQSYMLSQLGQRELGRTLFPLGGLEKKEVRQLAHNLGLSVADREESQDLCFVDRLDYHEFLDEHLHNFNQPGEILSRDGKLLGKHSGLAFYTIGQRKGLPAFSEALFVIEKDPQSNRLIVGTADQLGKIDFQVSQINWIAGIPPSLPFETTVKIRYRAKPVRATISAPERGRLSVELDEPLRDITPGQAAVFYQGDQVLGGGIISASLP